MKTAVRAAGALLVAALAFQVALRSETAVSYRFTFPEPQHHWMSVEVLFTELSSAPLELRMSRSSPGRYSLHDFAKNVYDVEAVGPNGRALSLARPDPYGWTVPEHGAAVTVTVQGRLGTVWTAPTSRSTRRTRI